MRRLKEIAAATAVFSAFGMPETALDLLCTQPAYALGETTTAQTSVPITSAPSRTAQAFAEMSKFQSGKAINLFTGPLVETAKKDWQAPETKRQLARYFALEGRCLAVDDNLVAASQSFLISHRLQPNDPSYTAYLADSLMRTGRDAEGEKLFQVVKQDAATNLISARTYVRYLMRQERYAEAEHEMQRVMKLPGAKKDWRLHQISGRIFTRRGYSKKALEQAGKAVDLTPDKYSAELLTASAFGLQRKRDLQEEHLQAAGRIVPDDGLWQTNLAQCTGSDRALLARDYYVNALHSRRFVTKAVFNYGNYALGSDNPDNAAVAQSALDCVVPWHEQTFQLRGRAQRKHHELELAAKTYAQLVTIHPHLPLGYTLSYDLFNERKDFENAIKIMQLCTTRLPGFANGWRRLGDAYYAVNKLEDAKAAYDKSLTLLATDLNNLNELAKAELSGIYAGIGCYYYSKGDKDKAFEYAEKSNVTKFVPELPWYLKLIQIRPGYIDWHAMTKKEDQEAAKHALLADMLRQKRLQDCITEYRKATELNPDNVEYHTYLLDALSEGGDWMGAAGEDWQASSKMVNKLPSKFGDMFKKAPAKSEHGASASGDDRLDKTPHLIPALPGSDRSVEK